MAKSVVLIAYENFADIAVIASGTECIAGLYGLYMGLVSNSIQMAIVSAFIIFVGAMGFIAWLEQGMIGDACHEIH